MISKDLATDIQGVKLQINSKENELETNFISFKEYKENSFSSHSINFLLGIDSKTDKSIPTVLQNKINDFKKKGGLEKQKNLLSFLKEISGYCEIGLTECEKSLKNEENIDSDVNKKYKLLSSRTPSKILNQDYFITLNGKHFIFFFSFLIKN